MTSIFGTVTAEVAEDVLNTFPTDFDFDSMIEKVSKDAGVVLLVSEQHYKFQGLWLSIIKAYEILTKVLAVNNAKVGTVPLENDTIIKNEMTNGNVYPCDIKPIKLNNKHNNATSDSDIITSNLNGSSTNNFKIVDKNPRAINVENEVNSILCEYNKEIDFYSSRTLRKRSNTKNESKVNTVVSKKNNKKTKVPAVINNDKVKHIKQSENEAETKLPLNSLKDLSDSFQKRKRGRPKKTPQLTSFCTLKVVKQKIYKYTRYKSNFVRRPFSIRSLPKANEPGEVQTDELPIENDDDNDADVTEEDFIGHNQDEEDDEDEEEVSIKKRGRGRPKRKAEDKCFPCSDCDFIGENGNMLNDHKHRTHRACPTKCDVCLKVFPNKRYMMRHRASHVEPQHCCDICGKMYKVKKSMEEHRKTHDVGYTKPVFDCSQCSKQFCNGYILKCHIKSEHLGEKKSFLCSRCGKSFTTKHSLQEHSNAHTGLKPHICDICGKGFNYESALRDHKYTHTESRKFSCTICNKHFCQRSSLKMHLRIHAVEKKFVCEDCGRGFTQKQALQRHERVHKGFKPFVCKLCRRNFTDSSIIRRHLILVHKIHKDSNSWREDIICKIGPTQFRVEKMDSSKNENERLQDEMIEALPLFQTENAGEHSYSTKDDYDSIEQGVSVHVDPIPNNISQNVMDSNLLLPPLPQTTQSMKLPQVMDYSDRNTNSVNSIHSSHTLMPDNGHNNLVEERLQDTPVAAISPSVWEISASVRDQMTPNHHLTRQLIPTTTQLQQQIVSVHTDPGTNDMRDYQHQQSIHIERSATPQYLVTHEIDTQMRCGNINYPHQIRHDIQTDQNHSSGTQWTSDYAYYSQLASQFGMNLNEYPPPNYIQSQQSPQNQQQ